MSANPRPNRETRRTQARSTEDQVTSKIRRFLAHLAADPTAIADNQPETRLAHLQTTSEAAGILLTQTTNERDQLRAAFEHVRTLADDGPPAGTAIGGEWEGGWDSAMDAVKEALGLGLPSAAATKATEPVSSPAREQITAVIRDFPFDNYGLNEVSYLLEDTPETQEWVPALATAVLAAIPPATRITASLARDSEATVQRVIGLYGRWVKAGPPPLGTSVARWWDTRLVELHDAIRPPAPAETETPEHPA